MKVMTIVGTRPEIIKLSRVIPELDRHTDHWLVHTGQNQDPELYKNIFADLGLRAPDVSCSMPPISAMQFVSDALRYVDHMLELHRPNAVLVLGDTNSALSVHAAKRRQIPIFHMEAGNRCFDQRVPEETNRKIVDHISDINMPYTEHARRNLLAEGIAPDRIIKTGSPMREVLDHYSGRIADSTILQDLELAEGYYFVVSAHREENVDDPERLASLVGTVNSLSRSAPVVFSVHPRTRKRLHEQKFCFTERVEVAKPFGFLDYAMLQMKALCVISDSGTLAEEASILRFPAVTIRQAHERPEAADEGTLVMSDLVPERVLDAVSLAADPVVKHLDAPGGYASELVSRKVVRTIVSYTDYVRRNVWRKP